MLYIKTLKEITLIIFIFTMFFYGNCEVNTSDTLKEEIQSFANKLVECREEQLLAQGYSEENIEFYKNDLKDELDDILNDSFNCEEAFEELNICIQEHSCQQIGNEDICNQFFINVSDKCYVEPPTEDYDGSNYEGSDYEDYNDYESQNENDEGSPDDDYDFDNF